MDVGQPRGNGRRARPAGWATLALLLSALPVAAQAAERVALVIGNSAYEKAPILANPGNDARAVGDAFERLGYSVTRLENASRETLFRGLQDFKRAAGASDVAVVFYAGHGIEVDTRNFLIPVDATLARDDDVEYEAVPLNLVMRSVEGARRLGLVVLDACRDNPFAARMQSAGGTRSIGRGLARVAPSGGTLVAYAAEEGKTAEDGDGRNSPYTGALLAYLEEPGLDVGLLFRKVRAEVLRTTGGSQKPFEYGALPPEHIYLASAPAPQPETTGTAGVATAATPQPVPSGDAARAAYESAKEVGNVAAFQLVVEDFPGSFYAKLARAQIAKLEEEPLVVAGGDPVDDEEPPAGPSPEAVEGNLELSREDRRLVQMGLAAAGQDPGPADGMIGRGTREAIRRWQGAQGAPATGYLDADGAKELMGLGRKAREAEEDARRRRVAEEESSWKKCEQNDEARYCEEYLSRYEGGVHARQAKQRLAELDGPSRGDKFRDCPECPELVVVPSGSYRMGSPSSKRGRYDDEGPVHEVTIARPFAVGVYEVTFREWDACVSGGGCGGHRPDDEGWGRGNRPVVNVSWDDAKAYVRWLSGKTGEAYRLLSEAEWEYVARAGTRTARYWGESESGQCRYANGADREAKRHQSGWTVADCDDGHYRTAPVGSFQANGYGLHDVLGNVWEWTEDCWNGSYAGAPRDGRAWKSGDCSRRVLRGGSWFSGPRNLRSASRNRHTTGYRNGDAGFRVARTLTP